MPFRWFLGMMSSCGLRDEAYFPNSQRSRKEGGSRKEVWRTSAKAEAVCVISTLISGIHRMNPKFLFQNNSRPSKSRQG